MMSFSKKDLGCAPGARKTIKINWVIRLRWGAVLGQLLTVLVVSWFWRIHLPMPPMLGVLALTACSNLLLMWLASKNRQVGPVQLALIISFDIVLLTVLLYYSGGPTNPFNYLYLVHISLAAVTLPALWMWLLLLLTIVCFGGLFWHYVPLAAANSTGTLEALSPQIHQQGVAVSFVLAGVFIVYFVQRVVADLAEKETQLVQARDLRARDERLTSLATLAAGAAHELATPLATIAVVSKELERALKNQASAEICDDVQLIRQEVDRCRNVLTNMTADAGASAGESFVDMTLSDLLHQALDKLVTPKRCQLDLPPELAQTVLCIPARSIVQAIRTVVKNALEADVSTAPVLICAQINDNRCEITVKDTGPGMSEEVLSHVSEPFYTTKAPGVGMGLGLFLTRTVLERLGGNLSLQSAQNRGTTVVLTLPLRPQEVGESHERS